MRFVEELTSIPEPLSTADRATNILVSNGARFVNEALADNPDGPVQMITDVSRLEVSYEVVVGDPTDSMSTKCARTIWHRIVPFGASDRHVAGGAAFVEAARSQESVAWAALELMESRR